VDREVMGLAGFRGDGLFGWHEQVRCRDRRVAWWLASGRPVAGWSVVDLRWQL